MPTGVKIPSLEQIPGSTSTPVLPTGTVLVKNADTGVAVSIYNDRGLTSLLSSSGLTTVTRGKTVGYSAAGVTWAIYWTPDAPNQPQQGPFYFEANLGTVSADVSVFNTRLTSVESGTADPALATDTDTPSYDTSIGRAKWLRRDWRDVEEFSGTDAAKLAAAALQCATDGKIMRWKRGKTYSTSTTIDWSAALAIGKLHMETEGAELLKTAAVYAMRADGTETAKTNLTANVPAGSFTVTLPTGQGAAGAWAKGDIFAIEDASDVYGPDVGATVKYVRARELHEVYKVTGDVLTLAGPIILGYTTANGARYSKITPGGQLIIRGGLQIRGGDPSYVGYAAFLNRLKDPLTDDLSAYDHAGGLYHRECLGGIAMRYEARHNPSAVNPWYYNHVFGGACVGTRLIGYTVRGGESEASCTTLSDERAPVGGGGIDDTDADSPNGNTFWGGPIACSITDGDVELGSIGSCYGSHGAGLNNTWENCKGRGGQINFMFRDRGRKMIGCTGEWSAARGIDQPSSAEDAQIIGGEISFSTTEGAALAAARARVLGLYVHDAGTYGLALSGDDAEVLNGAIRGSGRTGAGGVAAIICSGGSNKRIEGVNMPKSTTQLTAILNLGATDQALRNHAKGYGSTVPWVTPTVGAKFIDNVVDQYWTIASAATIAIPGQQRISPVSGTTTITGITALPAPKEIILWFTGICQVSDGGNLKLAGNYVSTVGGTLTLFCDGTNWYEVARATP